MSQYLHIFVKHDHTYTPLLCVSRNTCIYRLFQDSVPYEKITMITPTQVSDAAEFALTRYNELDRLDAAATEWMAKVGTWDNTVEEKMEYIHQIQQDMDEREIEKDEWLAAYYYLTFLSEIEDYLYAGIECGENVTDADVED